MNNENCINIVKTKENLNHLILRSIHHINLKASDVCNIKPFCYIESKTNAHITMEEMYFERPTKLTIDNIYFKIHNLPHSLLTIKNNDCIIECNLLDSTITSLKINDTLYKDKDDINKYIYLSSNSYIQVNKSLFQQFKNFFISYDLEVFKVYDDDSTQDGIEKLLPQASPIENLKFETSIDTHNDKHFLSINFSDNIGTMYYYKAIACNKDSVSNFSNEIGKFYKLDIDKADVLLSLNENLDVSYDTLQNPIIVDLNKDCMNDNTNPFNDNNVSIDKKYVLTDNIAIMNLENIYSIKNIEKYHVNSCKDLTLSIKYENKIKTYKIENNESFRVFIDKIVILRKEIDNINDKTPIDIMDTTATTKNIIRYEGIYYDSNFEYPKDTLYISLDNAIYDFNTLENLCIHDRVLNGVNYKYTIYTVNMYKAISNPYTFIL